MTEPMCDCGHSAWMHVWGAGLPDKAYIAQCCEHGCCCQHFNVATLRALRAQREQAVASGRARPSARTTATRSRRRKGKG